MEISINQSYSINGSKIIRSFITRNVFTLCGKANTDYRTSLLQITINHERSKPKLFSLIVRSCLSFQTGIFRKILDKWMISDLSEKPLQDAETIIDYHMVDFQCGECFYQASKSLWTARRVWKSSPLSAQLSTLASLLVILVTATALKYARPL